VITELPIREILTLAGVVLLVFICYNPDAIGLTTIGGRGRKDKRAPRPLNDPYATKRDIRDLLAKEPTEGRISFAYYDNWLLETLPDHSLIVFGGARSRKTSCIVAPATRVWAGTAIVLSTKPDLYTLTVNARRPGGIAMYYPNGKVPAGVRSIGWNPLDEIAEAAAAERGQTLNNAWGTALRMAQGMTNQAGREGGDLHFWMDLAQLALAPLLLAAAVSPAHDIDAVPRWIKAAQSDSGMGLIEPMNLLAEYNAPAQATQALDDLAEKEQRAQSSILTTMTTTLMAYEDSEVLATATQPDRFRPWHLDDPTKELRTLYLLGSSHDQKRLAPIFLGLLDEVARYYYRKADELMIAQDEGRQIPVVAPRDRLLLVLDEAANAAPIPDLDGLASQGGSHGVCLLLVYQDLSQLRQRLGQDKAATVVANCQSRIVTPGMADEATLATVNGLLSTQPMLTTSTTTTKDGKTTTDTVTEAPILTAATLRQLEVGQGIVITGNDRPIRVRLLPQTYGSPLAATKRRRRADKQDGPTATTAPTPAAPTPVTGKLDRGTRPLRGRARQTPLDPHVQGKKPANYSAARSDQSPETTGPR